MLNKDRLERHRMAEILPCVYGSSHMRGSCARSSERAGKPPRTSHPLATLPAHPRRRPGSGGDEHVCPRRHYRCRPVTSRQHRGRRSPCSPRPRNAWSEPYFWRAAREKRSTRAGEATSREWDRMRGSNCDVLRAAPVGTQCGGDLLFFSSTLTWAPPAGEPCPGGNHQKGPTVHNGL